MLGIAHNPSTRTVYKVALCLRLVALAMLGALVLAASAQAADEAPAGGVSSTEAPSTPLAPEAGGSGAISEELPGVSTPPLVPGEAQEAVSTPVAAEKTPEAVSTPVAAEKTPETVSTPVAAEKAPETVSTPVTPEKAPVSDPAPENPQAPEISTPVLSEVLPLEKAPESPKIAAGPEKETGSVAVGPEKASEDPPPPTIADSPVTLTRSDLGYATPEIGYEAAPDVPGALINSPTEPPTGGSLEAGAAEAAASVAAVAQISNAQRAGELSCELSSLSGDMSGSCSTEWLAPQVLLSGSPAGYAAAVAALAPSAGPPGDGGHGGAAVGSPPVSPGPGPAPAGASGSSAGATGLALSGFLTLAGLLLLGAPRAMRRLRLSCQPWLTACFVLIPERPG
jgi:hypothetical protein